MMVFPVFDSKQRWAHSIHTTARANKSAGRAAAVEPSVSTDETRAERSPERSGAPRVGGAPAPRPTRFDT